MRSTLFLIPFEIRGVPLFGLGVLLAIWAVGCAVTLALCIRRHGWGREVLEYLPAMALLGAAIYWLPAIFSDLGGMPIRGYGVMVLVGASGGIGLAAWRARRMGLDPEVIVSVCFWMIVAGIVCARLFYVIQYWETDFRADRPLESLKLIANFTHGGLVIYGAILGGAGACLWYVFRHQLPALAIGDLIMPGLAFGIAVGRIGCFMHGCCYGGVCDRPWAVTFPAHSPPYEHQVFSGQLPEVAASDRGLGVTNRRDAVPLPPRSLPVHPTQLYSAIHAAALALVLWSFYPFRRRDGQVVALMMLLYPIGRFLLEMVRTDEPGRFGTSLTISQWISLMIFIGGIALWTYLRARPAKPVLPPTEAVVVA